MNNSKKRSAEREKRKARFMFSSAHVIIAIVAIIECLILISFTTYSWIETASSLIIWNGKKSIIDSEYTKMDIVGNLKYRFQVSSSTPNTSNPADLGEFFRSVDYFQYAKTSSPDGRNFFFKRPLASNSYRQGDTTDYNTSYLYFDFNVLNYGYSPLKKLKFYFADDDVFSVTGIDSTKCETLKNAMRLSIQAGDGTPKIYAESATPTTARSNATTGTVTYTPTAIESNENLKLFTVAKHNASSAGTNVSCRVWLESEASGMSSITYSDLAAANISVNLRLTYAENETDFLYFDDYTFSTKDDNMGGHLTADNAESDSYRMYFVYKASSSATGVVYPMTRASSQTNPDALSWVTCDSTGNESATVLNTDANPYITNLCNASHAAVTNSYFAYGPCSLTQSSVPTSFAYKWFLNSNSNDDNEHRFNAYSVVRTKLSAGGSVTNYGAGGWNWNTPLTMVYFRDRATGITDNSYNTGSNFKYITDAANSATNSVIYLNNVTANIPTASATMQTQAKATAALYYDVNADNRQGLFKSFVPTSWTTGSSMTFRYCPNGAYCLADEQIQWSAGAPTRATNSNDYIYTALGYDSLYTCSYYNGRTSSPIYATGSGTWNAILSEPVYFSTELIDNDASSADRYTIGVKIGSASAFTKYALAPVTDGANQKFFAYLPDPNNGNSSGTADYTAGKICFTSYDKYSSASQTATQNAYWIANARNAGSTFYPVKFNAANTSNDYTRGYWHISVIVDGTYEHLFWDTGDPDTSADDGVLGHFYYNTSGHETPFNASNYTEITPYQLDQYRWYVPLDDNPNASFIFYRWLPYDDVDLMFNHNISTGIYCIVTEASDATGNASSGALASFGMDDFSLNYLFGRNNAEPDSAVTEPEDEASDQSETYEDEEVIEEYVEEDFSYVDEDQTVDEYTDETVNNE